MILKHPFEISSRLLPALHIGNGWLQLEHVGQVEGRCVYRWTIDIPAGEFSACDLKSGTGDLADEAAMQRMFGSLLAFLTAAAGSYKDGERGEPANLFPRKVVKWAVAHIEDLDALQETIESTKDLICKET